MAQGSWPSPNHNDRHVNESEYEKLSARYSDDGLYGSPADPPPVVAGAGLQVILRAGLYGNLRGFGWTSGPDDVPFDLAPNTSGSQRIDRLVLRLDRSTWDVRAVILQGTPGAGYPLLTRDPWDTGLYEEPIAEIPVPNNATSVSPTLRPLYVGTRVRAANSWAKRLPTPALGEITHEPDTGRWTGFDGTADRVLYEDTGWVALQTVGSTAGPDAGAWTNNVVSRVRRRNDLVSLRLAVRRWNTNGLGLDDANGSVPFTLPATFRPDVYEIGFGYHSRSPVAIRVEPDGSVRLYPLETNLPPGRTILGGADYLV